MKGSPRLSSIAGFAVFGMSPTIFPFSRYLEISDTPTHPTVPDLDLLHQNQPPDGSRPLRRRYVTRLP